MATEETTDSLKAQIEVLKLKVELAELKAGLGACYPPLEYLPYVGRFVGGRPGESVSANDSLQGSLTLNYGVPS